MKILGNVELSFNEDGTCKEAEYAQGVIVQLTYKEMSALVKLNTVINEQQWNNTFLRFHMDGLEKDRINNVDFSESFDMIIRYVTQKFYLNQMKDNITEMEELLCNLESKDK